MADLTKCLHGRLVHRDADKLSERISDWLTGKKPAGILVHCVVTDRLRDKVTADNSLQDERLLQDRQTDEWMDGWMDGLTYEQTAAHQII